MDTTDQPRSQVTYEIARILVLLPSGRGHTSPVYSAQQKIDKLRDRGEIPEREHNRLGHLLQSLLQCDMDRDERIEDLVRELTMNLTVWQEEFPIAELKRLRGLL